MTTLGKLIDQDDKAELDAVHVATAPVKATQTLNPGDHIGFTKKDTIHVGKVQNPIGIVDPFLQAQVKPGQEFLICLYPGSITSLKHSWTHPTFLAMTRGSNIDAEYVTAREEIERIAHGNEQLTGEELIQGAQNYLDSGENMYQGSRFESCSVGDDFWDAFEIVTEQAVQNTKRDSFFGCSC